jgi:hypothetical protein
MKRNRVMIVVIAIALSILFHHSKTYKSAEQAPNKVISPKTQRVTKEVDLFTNISFWS